MSHKKFSKNIGWRVHKESNHNEIENIIPRPHQENAINFLKESDFVGFLEMATGSGKTKAAILSSYNLFKDLLTKNEKLLTIIIVPDSYLVDQWFNELFFYSKNVVRCYSENLKWKKQLNTKISRIVMGSIDHCYIVATLASLKFSVWEKFILKRIKNQNIKLLFIGDEAHTLGAPTGQFLLNKLEQYFINNYKIGLSATPIREYDEKGTKLVLKWFSNNKAVNIFRYSLKDAQINNSLMNFYYFPIECSLNYDEYVEFEELTRKIGKKLATIYDEELIAEDITVLLNLRADILKKAKDKSYKLKILLETLLNDPTRNIEDRISNMVIFCKDGEQVSIARKVIENLNKEISLKNQIKYHTIDGSDENYIRINRINDLINKNVNLLIVMKCLDRGVDIPLLEKGIFMSSSGTELEHIQRTGRLLRIEKNKKGPVEIYDLFIFPTDSQITDNFIIADKIFEIEKKRINFFTEIAENKEEIQDLMWDLEPKLF